MSTPLLTKDARGFVEGVVGYLKRNGKARSTVPKVTALLRRVTTRVHKDTLARVESPVVLSASEKQALGGVLSKLTGHSVRLDLHVNPALLGGIRITVGDWIVDTSLSYQLELMGKNLL